jgi:hypothetical protein
MKISEEAPVNMPSAEAEPTEIHATLGRIKRVVCHFKIALKVTVSL